MDLWSVLFRFAVGRLFPIGESGRDLLNCFRRNLEVRALRPIAGTTHEEILEQLRGNAFGHLSQVYSRIEEFDAPPWRYDPSPYVADSDRAARAEALFSEIRTFPFRTDESLDDVVMGGWDKFLELGKPALGVFCARYREAVEVRDAEQRADVIHECVGGIDRAASRIVDIPDFPALARSLRVDPGALPPAPQAPVGLLHPLLRLLADPRTSSDIDDPAAWWRENERFIPDVVGPGEPRVLELG